MCWLQNWISTSKMEQHTKVWFGCTGRKEKTQTKHRGKRLTYVKIKGLILQWFLSICWHWPTLKSKTHRIASNTSGLVLNHKILINIPAPWCTSTVTSTIILKSMWHSSYFSGSSLTPTYKRCVHYGKRTQLWRENWSFLHRETSLIQGDKVGAR